MNDLENLDQRAHRAAADVRSRVAARPCPSFDPDDVSLLPAPARVEDRRPRRSLLAAAAVILLVLAGGLALVVRQQGGDSKGPANPITTTTGPPRPFVAGDLTSGLALRAAVTGSPGSEDGETGPLLVLGPTPEEPTIGIAVEATPGDGWRDAPRVKVDGRSVITLGPDGPGRASAVDVRGKRSVILFGSTDDIATLVAIAPKVVVNGRRPSIADADLPEGIRRLTEEPDAAAMAGAIAVMSGGLSEGYLTVYGEGTEADGALVTVTSTPGDVTRLNGIRLYDRKVDRTTVRGHDALVSEQRAAGSGGLILRTLSWLERPGELLRVSGYGVSEADLRSMAEELRPVSDEDWKSLVGRSQLGELEADGPGRTTLGRGSFADGTAWVLRSNADSSQQGSPPMLDLKVALEGGGDTSQGSSGSGQGIGSRIDQPALIFSQTLLQHKGRRHFAAGLLRSDVATVELFDEKGRAAGEATMLDTSTGRAWVVEVTADPTVAVARSGDGRELGRCTYSNLDTNESPEVSEGPSPTVPVDPTETTMASGNPEPSGSTAGSELPPPGQPDPASAPALPGN